MKVELEMTKAQERNVKSFYKKADYIILMTKEGKVKTLILKKGKK